MRMKKILFLVFSLVVIMLCCRILIHKTEPYRNWKSVSIQSFGTIKLPEEFEINIDDKLCGRVVQGKKAIMEVYSNGNLPYNIVYVKTLEDINYSNSATLYLNEYIIDGRPVQKFEIKIWNGQQHLKFILMDEALSQNDAVKITKSYLME